MIGPRELGSHLSVFHSLEKNWTVVFRSLQFVPHFQRDLEGAEPTKAEYAITANAKKLRDISRVVHIKKKKHANTGANPIFAKDFRASSLPNFMNCMAHWCLIPSISVFYCCICSASRHAGALVMSQKQVWRIFCFDVSKKTRSSHFLWEFCSHLARFRFGNFNIESRVHRLS